MTNHSQQPTLAARLQQLGNRARSRLAGSLAPAAPGPTGSILDVYVATAPSAQNAVDIFTGEWSSQLPAPLTHVQTGPLQLFDDARIHWAIQALGGVEGCSVLELGPLEAGHTYMLEQAGAASVLAIEANTRAYLKCLVVKELLELQKARFLCGDFMEYLRAGPPRFDVCVASGVLYHMRNPAELIQRIAQITDRVFIWTHYYDAQRIQNNPQLAPKFSEPVAQNHAGFAHQLYRQDYLAALDLKNFCGAGSHYTNWLTRADLLACLEHFGLGNIQIDFEQPDHVHGPALALVASRN